MATKTLTLRIELDIDDKVFPFDDEREWFRDEILGGELVLHSNVIGDAVGPVRVLNVEGE